MLHVSISLSFSYLCARGCSWLGSWLGSDSVDAYSKNTSALNKSCPLYYYLLSSVYILLSRQVVTFEPHYFCPFVRLSSHFTSFKYALMRFALGSVSPRFMFSISALLTLFLFLDSRYLHYFWSNICLFLWHRVLPIAAVVAIRIFALDPSRSRWSARIA